jgi:hypothetical protein
LKRFAVSSRGRPSVEVQASNWVTALGLGLEHYDVMHGIERLACEVLPNGTVIARDISSGNGFIVREALESVEEAVLGPPEPPSGIELSSIVPSSSGLRARLARVRDAETRGKACQVALVLARRLVTAESGAVILSDREYLRFFAAAGPQAQRLLGAKLPADTGIAAFCIRQQRSVVLEDAAVDPRHIGDIDRLTGYVTHALACVPVMHLDRVFGVIELINLPDNTAFSRQCVHELNAIAQALGERLERHRMSRLTG